MEKKKGILYIVATPIGNLEDITLRALRILKEADVILCEDTRVTKKLLQRYDIQKPLVSYHQHSRLSRMGEIAALLRAGKHLALVSDAGTPGISDPGNELIQKLLDEDSPPRGVLSSAIAIVPIPGPSAVSALAGVAGFPMQRFYFGGYPPQKKGRETFFKKLAEMRDPIILFESPHRIQKTIRDLHFAFGPSDKARDRDTRYIVVGRELTKQFETLYRGTLHEVAGVIEKEKPRGEYVLAIV